MTKSRARDYKPSTVKLLHTLSGNQCAAPDCNHALIAKDGETIISKICHIAAASPDGPRWDAGMDDDQRRHFDNLILMCDECHSMIDNKNNVGKYNAVLLKEWKSLHESTSTYSHLSKKPSLLGMVVEAIADMDLKSDADYSYALRAFEIEDKIEFNDIQRNIPLIEEYKVFYMQINGLYQTLEMYGSFKKINFLRNIKHVYIKVKGRYFDKTIEPIQFVRANADNIIEGVQDELLKLVEQSVACSEDAAFAISIVVVDAFMRCKILERPQK